MDKDSLQRICLLLLCVLIQLTTKAQKDSIKFRVSYSVSHLLDTTNEKSRISYELYLFIGEEMSLSESKNKFYNDSISAVYKQMALTNSNITINIADASPKRISSLESIITHRDFSKRVFTEIGQISFDKYVIEDSIKPINWNLKNEFSTIKGRKCQLAECFYKGRYWKVWFTPEISLSEGPWKLYGLPGLILNAQDEKNEISFNFIDIVKISDKELIVLNKNKAEKATQKQFMNLLKAYADNPTQYFQNQTGISLNAKEFNQNTSPPKMKAPNNPIDLTKW